LNLFDSFSNWQKVPKIWVPNECWIRDPTHIINLNCFGKDRWDLMIDKFILRAGSCRIQWLHFGLDKVIQNVESLINIFFLLHQVLFILNHIYFNMLPGRIVKILKGGSGWFIDYGLFTPYSTASMLLNSKMYILFELNHPGSCNQSLKFQKLLFLISILNYP